ncbi:MAG TPA: hypothetical protein VFI39_05510 [Gemmatimonadales bacterium]|nr:hypothetical protein [Gemmatimonadales bacterium]
MSILVAVSGAMTGLVLSIRALGHLTAVGEAHRAEVIARNLVAPRGYFTPAGWRLLWAGRLVIVGTLVFVAVALWLSA